jgi:outer membrane receptor protein involved in Fe transport
MHVREQQMGNNRKLQFAIRAALAAAAASASVPIALSQTVATATTAGTATDTTLQEVVVTGSRLQQSPNDISISPVTSVTALDIQQTGLVRAEDILNNLPQVIAEQSSGTSISSNGTATVSLRGLGSQRTQVLVNGKRLMPGAGIGPTVASSPDINQIPADLIERVDVLTGGASAVYGADAVAGVVNFVLNTHFEGVRLDANYGFGMHHNGDSVLLDDLTKAHQPLPDSTVDAGFNKDVSFLAGANFADGKGNATVYATYLRSSPAVGYQYDFAGCTLNTPSKLPGPGGLKCGGSSSSATGRFLLLGATPNSAFATLADKTVDHATGTFRDYGSADSYNYGALSYLQRAAERYTAGSFLNYDINDSTNVYSEFMFARNTSSANYGPSGEFAFGTPTIHCDAAGAPNYNPLLTAGERATLCSPANIAANQATFGGTGQDITLYLARRSVESGPRVDNYSSNSIREILGVKGKWSDALSYDLYGQVGITHLQDVEGGFLGQQQINNSLQPVVDTRPGSKTLGQAVCASVITGTDPNCVPWNIWAPGGVNAAQLKYLVVPSSYGITAKEYIADGSVTADLGKYGIKIPTADNGISVNLGAEYRSESYDFDPDFIFANGFAAGGNGAQNPIHGGFHVSEAFTEARVPIMNDKPGAYDISADMGYRYSTYTSGFNTNTFKFGIEWAPVQDARIRGGFNRAVRAPSIGDLFSPAVVGAGGTADPCWGAAVGGTVNGHSLAFCQNTGVTAAEFGHILANPAAQINTSIGGNPALTPEIADTYTYGVVFQPRFVPGLVVSVDYYRIVISNTITSLSSNTIVNNCGLTGNATLCGLIHRGAGTGSLWFNNTQFVNAQEVNIGTVSTKGIDLASHYTLDIGPGGKLGFSLSGTRVLNFLTQPLPTGGAYDCVGYMGTTCFAPTPAWRHVLNTTWMAPWAGLSVTARWRYLGPVKSDRVSQDPQLSQTYLAATSHIGGYSYIDMSASIPIASTGISFRLGVNNLTDKPPPIVANGNYSDCPNTSCNDNTWVGTYDTLGRYLYAHVSAKF